MKNKLVKASLAGVAVVAIAAGGTTFSAWSDYDTLEGSQAGAEELTLVLNEPNTQNFDNMKLAPGVGNDFEFVVASRQGQTIPNASLRLQLVDLIRSHGFRCGYVSERGLEFGFLHERILPAATGRRAA